MKFASTYSFLRMSFERDQSFVIGGAASNLVDPDSTGLNPAWRTSWGIVEFGLSWPEGSSASQTFAARKKIVKNIEVIDKVAGPASTYFNEVGRDSGRLDVVLNIIDHSTGVFVREEP